MSPRKKWSVVVTGERRLTRQQTRLNNTPAPKACPHLPGGSFALRSRFRKNTHTFPEAAKRLRGKVYEEQGNVMNISDEYDDGSTDEKLEHLQHLSTANDLCLEANLLEESVDRSDDASPRANSDKDSQSMSESKSNFEAEIATYAKRPANTRSNLRAEVRYPLGRCLATTSNVNGAFRVRKPSNSGIIDDVQCNLDAPFSAIGKDVSAQNVPTDSAGNGIGTTSRIEPTTASATAVEGTTARVEPTPASATAVEGPQETACNLSRTCSFGLTELVGMNDLECEMDEVQSPAVETVHGYVVKPKFVPILSRIIDKYGDIAENFNMESIKSRSSSLEIICEIIQMLQEKTFNELSLDEIKNMRAQVCDYRKIGMAVEWLVKRLEDVEVARHAIKESSSLKEEKQKNSELLKELNTKLEADRTQLNDCRRMLEFYKDKAEKLQETEKSTMDNLKKAQDNAMRLNQFTSDLIRKVRYFVSHPLVDDLI